MAAYTMRYLVKCTVQAVSVYPMPRWVKEPLCHGSLVKPQKCCMSTVLPVPKHSYGHDGVSLSGIISYINQFIITYIMYWAYVLTVLLYLTVSNTRIIPVSNGTTVSSAYC
jgi:hypothetical protein